MLQENTKGVMRARDGAIFLGIGTSTFWKWHAEGKLPRGIRLSSHHADAQHDYTGNQQSALK